MPAARRCIFVLWGEQCDEAAAALFVTSLRAAGLRVWVVGISGKRSGGAYGLRFVADLALDQAMRLASEATTVIIPCTLERWAVFRHDPRLLTLVATCVAYHAQILMAEGSGPVDLPEFAAASQVFYPSGVALLPFAQRLAASLPVGS